MRYARWRNAARTAMLPAETVTRTRARSVWLVWLVWLVSRVCGVCRVGVACLDMNSLPVLAFALTAATAQDSSQFTRRDVMIPARDGVKLHTVIFTPKIFTPKIVTPNAASLHLPILL